MSHRKPTEPKVRSTPPDSSHSWQEPDTSSDDYSGTAVGGHHHSFNTKEIVEVNIIRQPDNRIRVEVKPGNPYSHSTILYGDEVTVHHRSEE